MDDAIGTYISAWNESDVDQRRRMLAQAVTDDVVLVDPTGRWRRLEGLVDRIGRYQSSAPGTEVVVAGEVDAHNDVVRYRWRIVDAAGHEFMEGLDVAERADDGRLKRIFMFHGPLSSSEHREPAGVRIRREDSIQLGAVTITYVHAAPDRSYSLLEWIAPARTPSPPVHIHSQTDEGFYVLEGEYEFMLDDARIRAGVGEHVLVPKGHPHTFWNSGAHTGRCLIVLSPPGFEHYFRELAHGLALSDSDDAATEVRRRLSARYDIEVVGPPITPVANAP